MFRLPAVTFLTALTAIAATNASSRVTFNRDVMPIMQQKCQECHRPGEVAPMSFMTYAEARPWAKAIKESVLSRKMPPWFADAEFDGHFTNERRLTPAQVKVLTEWVDAGAPEGNAKDKPPAARFAEGWSIGKPDMVVEFPHEL